MKKKKETFFICNDCDQSYLSSLSSCPHCLHTSLFEHLNDIRELDHNFWERNGQRYVAKTKLRMSKDATTGKWYKSVEYQLLDPLAGIRSDLIYNRKLSSFLSEFIKFSL